MRTPKEIMEASFRDAMAIVKEETKHFGINGTHTGQLIIAASNLAIAIFSYETSIQEMKNADNQEDDDEINLDDVGNNQNG